MTRILAEHHSEADERHTLSMPGSAKSVVQPQVTKAGSGHDELTVANKRCDTGVVEDKVVEGTIADAGGQGTLTEVEDAKVVQGTLTEAEQQAIAAVDAKLDRKRLRGQDRKFKVAKRGGANPSSVQESDGGACFAGRRPPQNPVKRQVFNNMVSIYWAMVGRMREEGKSASSTTSNDLQKDFWKFMKDNMGGELDSDDDKMKQAAMKWVAARFHAG